MSSETTLDRTPNKPIGYNIEADEMGYECSPNVAGGVRKVV